MSLSDLRFWATGVLVAVILPFGSAIHGQSAPAKRNKVLVYPTGTESVSQLKQRGIERVVNYGSYWLVEATDDQVASLKASYGKRAVKADYLNKVELAATCLDTTAAEPTIPSHLQQSDTAGKRLRLIQFKGPVKAEWLEQVKAAGDVKIVSYIPNNAYVLYLDQAAEQNLGKLTDPNGPIQWIGKYHPYYKLSAGLQQSQSGTVNVRVAVVDGPEAGQTVFGIQGAALKGIEKRETMLNQTVVTIQVRPADLSGIAQLPDVLWIEPVVKNMLMDEVQDLVLAGAPTGSYLNYLTNTLGFSTSPGQYPVVDICDTGLDEPNTNCVILNVGPLNPIWPLHPSFYQWGGSVADADCCALGATRVVYNTVGSDTYPHGTHVASIVAGYDDLPDETINCYTSGTRDVWPTNIINTVCITTNWSLIDPNTMSCDCTNSAICQANFCTVSYISNACPIDVYPTNTVCAIITNQPSPPFPANVARGGASSQLGLGVSPFGRIGASSYLSPNVTAAYMQTARISNNSWGQVLSIGGNDGVYDGSCQSYDASVRDALLTGGTGTNTPHESPVNQEMIFVFAGGNAGSIDPVGGYGDMLVTPPATAKNVISVGASDYSQGIAAFSSFGPTRDGRFKPDIVAPGVGINGALSQATYTKPICAGCDPNNPSPPLACPPNNNITVATITQLYESGSGTSFSAPAVSGGIQLLWWWFQNHLLNEQGRHLLQPSPAMAKAYLVNSARYLPITSPQTGVEDTLPSIAQGMGMMDLARMFDGVPRLIRDETTPRAIDSPMVTTNTVPQQTFFTRSGQSYEVSGQVADPGQPFRVTLSWTDPPGTPMAFKELVNDLDLEVTMVNGGVTNVYKGNQFAGANSVTGCPDPNRPCPDDVNNTESVFLPAVAAGTPYTVLVRAVNIAADSVLKVKSAVLGQDFALVVYNTVDGPFGSLNAPSDVPNLATNDTCQTAITITNFPFSFANVLTNGVYTDVHPSPSAARGGIEEFFKIQHPAQGALFQVTSSGSNSVLSIWRGACGALVELVSSADVPVTLVFAADGTNDYHIIVDGLNGGNGNVQLDISRSVIAPVMTLSTNRLDFGTNMVGTTSATQSVVVVNSGNAAFLINSVTLGGINPGDFRITLNSCSGASLLPGQQCEIDLAFRTTTTLPRFGLLTISSTATNSPQVVSLSGNGAQPAPAVCASSGALAFGDQFIGSTSSVQSVTITNCGSVALVVSNAVITGVNAGDFAIASSSCSSVLPGGACAVGVTFTPAALGARSAVLTINDNAPGSPHSVSLGGTGVAPAPLVCVAGTLAFGDQFIGSTSSVQSVTITNCGAATLVVTNTVVAGANAGDFAIVSSSCSSVSPGGTCAVGVTFTPAALGARSAVLTITNNAAGSPHSVSLGGTGVPPAASVCVSSSLAFGNLVVGSISSVQSVTLSNCGVATLVVSNTVVTGANPGDFAIVSSSCSSVLPGGTCAVGVTFTPAALGARSAVLTINDNAPGSPHSVSLSGSGVSCALMTISPSMLPSLEVGIPYNQSLTVNGAVPPATVYLAVGSLPSGVTLSTNGVFSGTPTAVGTFSFKVGVTDANGCTGEMWYTVTVRCPTITISPSTLPGGTMGTNYNHTITATGGISPYTFAVTGGSLPAGLTLLTSGVLTGTPISVSSVFTVTATDTNGCQGSRSYTLILADPPLPITIKPTSLPAATQGQTYNQRLTASGGTGSLSFSVTGSLPPGLTLSSAGVISGTPTAGGTFNFTVVATDANSQKGSQAYALSVICPTITLSPSVLPSGAIDQSYSQTITASGGASPYSFAVTSGSLPPGLSLTGAGLLSGIPTAFGNFVFAVTATDANGCTGITAYGISIRCQALTLLPLTFPNVAIGTPYSQSNSLIGGTAPVTFTITSGSVPAGLTYSSAGVLSGAPTTVGTYNFTVTATETNGCAGSRAYSLVVSNPAPVSAAPDLQVSIAVHPTTGVSVLSNVTYTVTVTNAGSAQATGVSLTDTLPAGAELVSATTPYSQSVGAVSWSLGTLPAGGSAQVTVVVEAGKAGTLVNTATVGANESEPNSANNSAANSAVTVVSAADVDLAWVGSPKLTGKQSAKPTYSITAKLTCTNQGMGTSPAAKVRFYLSSTSSLADAVRQVGKDLSTGKLKAKQSRQITFRAKLSANASGYVIAVIDPDNVVPESDKTNNTIVMGQIP